MFNCLTDTLCKALNLQEKMESCSSSVATDQTDRCSNFSVISSLSQVGLTLHLQLQFQLFSAARAVNNERDGGGLVGELEKR